MNLAALIGIPFSYVSPQSYVETNVTGALNIVEAAKKFDLQKVIQTSTSEVYGSALYVPIDEKHPLQDNLLTSQNLLRSNGTFLLFIF